MSNFLITGCARSGTGYINKLFNTLGLPCGHESIFNRGLNQKTYPGLLEKWRNSNRGESSWYSAPFLFDLPKDIIIFHQIRDPFSVIKSILRLPSAGSTFLKDDSSGSKYVYSHCPDVKLGKSHAERALLYWIHWNTLIENELTNFNIPHFRYCINNLDVTTVKKMTNLLNFNISDDDIQ